MESEIEVTVRGTNGLTATIITPRSVKLRALLTMAKIRLGENPEEMIKSQDKCLTLVLPDIDISLEQAHIGDKSIVQVSPAYNIPDENKMRFKDDPS